MKGDDWWVSHFARVLSGHHQGDSVKVRVCASELADELEARGHNVRYLRRIIGGDLGATIYPADGDDSR